nr:hypothetical protein [Paraburkholderia caribensis]
MKNQILTSGAKNNCGVGYRNRFHHPYAGVYERYRARGIELSRSDEDGAARIEAGGASVSLERFRQTHRRYWMEP